MYSCLILNYILGEYINIFKTQALLILLWGTPKERPLDLYLFLPHGKVGLLAQLRYHGQGRALRTHSQHALKQLGRRERSQAREAGRLFCSLPPAAPAFGPQPPGSLGQCSPQTAWTPQTRYSAAGSAQPGSSCWTPCSAGCASVSNQMAVASSLFRSEGVKREKHRQQCSGGDGGRGRSFPARRSTLRSPAAHPAAAASIKCNWVSKGQVKGASTPVLKKEEHWLHG